MKIASNITDFLKKELKSSSIEDVWMRILKTHVKNYSYNNNKEDFSSHKDFSDYIEYEKDLLDNLSLVEISVLYEYSLALVDKNNRKETGSYYTPEDIADFMAKKSIFFDKEKVWLDPCSGIGNLSYHLALIQEDPEEFVYKYLILQDINALALKIAHVLFALYFQNKIEKLYDKISKNFILKDFLEDYDKTAKENTLFSQLMGNGIIDNGSKNNIKYDYVIVNPPYLSTTKNTNFITSSCTDLYGYFLEKIILNSKGFISITPQSFTNGKKFGSFRNLLIENMNELSVYVFDNIPDSVFKGYKYGSENSNTSNSVRASIIVAQNNNNNKCNKITSLLRWRSNERDLAIKLFDSELVKIDFLKDEIFPKVHKGTKEFYYEILEKKTIRDITVKYTTQHFLIVPSTPRYYITASKSALNRSSFHKLYFKNEEDLNKAYILINSSYMYWWWRVTDGGMTLSQEVLNSLPLIDNLNISNFKIKSLIEKLEKSEKENKVVKVNAGKNNENIKHPLSLINSINKVLISDTVLVENILKTHNNSFID